MTVTPLVTKAVRLLVRDGMGLAGGPGEGHGVTGQGGWLLGHGGQHKAPRVP